MWKVKMLGLRVTQGLDEAIDNLEPKRKEKNSFYKKKGKKYNHLES